MPSRRTLRTDTRAASAYFRRQLGKFLAAFLVQFGQGDAQQLAVHLPG